MFFYEKRIIRGILPLLYLLIQLSPVYAHDLEPIHMANIRVKADGEEIEVHVSLIMSLPPDERAKRLIAQYDLNRSGIIEHAEGRLLGDFLGPEAVGGFVLMADGRAPLPESAEALALSDIEGRIRVTVKMHYRLPPVEKLGFAILEKPGGGRVPSRPMLITMKYVEDDKSHVLVPPVRQLPGEEVFYVNLVKAKKVENEDESGIDSVNVDELESGGIRGEDSKILEVERDEEKGVEPETEVRRNIEKDNTKEKTVETDKSVLSDTPAEILPKQASYSVEDQNRNSGSEEAGTEKDTD